MRLILVFALLSVSFLAQGQQTREVRGMVQDTAGVNLVGVNVQLISEKDTLLTSTNLDGAFNLEGVQSPEFRLTFSLLGFQIQDFFYKVNPLHLQAQIVSIVLKPQRNILKEVVVFAVPMVIKEDTIQYNAAAYPTYEGALLEELLKKLPGVDVDRSGNVTAQGSQVTRVKVNGKDFFGGDVLTASRNLPAEIVENVQVIDDYGDQANFTGFKTTSPQKVLNITIKEDRNRGRFGQVTAGMGTDYRYLGSVSANSFDDDRQLAFLGSINNTNSSLFSYGDVLGLGGRGGSDLSNMIELDDGINRTNSAGFNVRNNVSSDIINYGSYVYTNRKNNTESTSSLTSNFPNNTILSNYDREFDTENRNHNLGWNLESNINGPTYFKISPTLSFGTSDVFSTSNGVTKNRLLTTERVYQSTDNLSSPKGAIDLIFNHRFEKVGRRASVSFRGNILGYERENHIDEFRRNIDSSFTSPQIGNEQLVQNLESDMDTKDIYLNASFIEPLSTKSLLELNYEHNYSWNKNNRDAINSGSYSNNVTVLDSTSMNYDYQFRSDQIGFNYQFNEEQSSYTIGFGFQPTNLRGYTLTRDIATDKKYINFVPSARFSFRINKFKSFSIAYHGQNKQPDFVQIQPVRDISNSQNVVIGNPDLGSEFINSIKLNYKSFDLQSGNSFFSDLSFQTIKNKIVANRIAIANTTIQETHFLNTDGYFDAYASYLYSLSILEQVFDINVSGSGNYSNNISFTNFQRNSGRYLVYTQGLELKYTQEDWLDLGFRSSFTLNQIQNSLISITNNEAYTWVFGLGGRTYFKKWSLSFDLSHRINNGFNDFIRADPTIMNVYLERTFMKNNRGALRIQGYDLFNQNTGVSHDVFGIDVHQTRNNRLGRYFLISLNFRLQKFPDIK